MLGQAEDGSRRSLRIEKLLMRMEREGGAAACPENLPRGTCHIHGLCKEKMQLFNFGVLKLWLTERLSMDMIRWMK